MRLLVHLLHAVLAGSRSGAPRSSRRTSESSSPLRRRTKAPGQRLETSLRVVGGESYPGRASVIAVGRRYGRRPEIMCGGRGMRMFARTPAARIAAVAGLVAVMSFTILGAAAAADASTFSGVLRDRNGDPLPYQQMSLNGGGFTINGRSGADGSFGLNAAPGLYTLQLNGGSTVFPPGPPTPLTIPTLPSSYMVSGVQIDLRDGDRQQDLRLPTLFLDVTALNPAGQPLANALIELRQSFPGPAPMPPSPSINSQTELFPGGTGSVFYSSSKTSDANGHTRLALFAADNLALALTGSGGQALKQLGSLQGDSSTTIQALASNRFSGVLRDRNGDPLPYQQMSLNGGGFTINGRSGADGSFGLNAAPGLYTLQLNGGSTVFPPGPPTPLTIPTLPSSYMVSGVQVDLRDGDRQQDLRLPTLFLDVSALNPAGQPLANALIELRQSFPGPAPMPPSPTTNSQTELFPGGSGSVSYSSSKTSDANGHTRLALFAADNLALALTGSGGQALKQLGSLQGDSSTTIQALASNRFSGVLRDRNGDPLPYQQLSLNGGGFTINGRSGADGSFGLNAAPGLYTLQLNGGSTVFPPGPPTP